MDIQFDSLDDLAALTAALPSDALTDAVAFDVRDEGGEITGHVLSVPAEWAAQAQALAADMTALRRSGLVAYLKDRRWRVETAGVWAMIAGEPVQVSTRRGDDRATLHATYTAIRDGLRPDGAAFNFEDGVGRPVSNADMSAAILAALGHVQACFDLELALTPQIETGAITTREQIDAAAWPSNEPPAPAGA